MLQNFSKNVSCIMFFCSDVLFTIRMNWDSKKRSKNMIYKEINQYFLIEPFKFVKLIGLKGLYIS